MDLGFAPGTVAMWTALLAGCASVAAYLYALTLQRSVPAAAGGVSFDETRGHAFDQAIGFARRLYVVFVGAIILASALLMRLLLLHDFRVSYVASYSSRDLPLRYLLSTFWAGQEGSFLLWLFFGALIGLFVFKSAKEQEPPVMAVYTLTFLMIVAILVKQSPFRFLAEVPPDGQGLNPLLQDPWMVIHPPVMFSGFASLSVPFAFAIAALLMKRWDGWVVRALPWALFSFITLGTAILMGGYWAYKTLGWGGYWGWDPVENTSLVPWLATVALLHGMVLQRTRHKHRKINIILAILAFCCILYGTFLTRSGVLADFSVHSFVDLGITSWLVAFILVFLVGGVGLLAFRWRDIPSAEEKDAEGKTVEEPFLSRSVLFILSITLLCASGFVILLGTSSPLLTRVVGKPSQVSTNFYNVTHAPVAALMALLVALVPYLSWRGETAREVLRKAFVSILAGVGGGVVAAAAGIHGVRDLAIVALASAGLWANLETVALFVKRRAITTMGGYLTHVGVAIMLVGILVSGAYEHKQQIALQRGKPVKVGRDMLTFTRAVFVTEDGRVKQEGELDMALLSDRRAKQAMEVQVATSGGRTWTAYPKLYMNPRTNQMMANPDVRSTPFVDTYVSPQAYDPGQPPRVEGAVLGLKKGQSQSAHGVTFKFLDFEADKSAAADAKDPRVSVLAHYLVSTSSGSSERTAKLVMHLSRDNEGSTEAIDTPIPGTPGRFRLRRVQANEGASEIEVLGLDPAGDLKPQSPETFSMDLTKKPLISLVWGGFYVMMAGGLVSIVRRARDARKAALA